MNAIGKKFHPECFKCTYCGKLFGNSPFFLEEGEAYCEADWNELFTTKCFACGFPVEAGDRWVEALNNNYHSQCFNCTVSLNHQLHHVPTLDGIYFFLIYSTAKRTLKDKAFSLKEEDHSVKPMLVNMWTLNTTCCDN